MHRLRGMGLGVGLFIWYWLKRCGNFISEYVGPKIIDDRWIRIPLVWLYSYWDKKKKRIQPGSRLSSDWIREVD